MIAGHHLIIGPLSGKHTLIGSLQKALIQQCHNADVLRCADHPACRLQHFVHPRVLISIVEAVFRLPVKILPDDLPLIADLGKTCSHNDRTDQPVVL